MGDSVPSVSNVLSAIKATLISRQDGILESELDADYRELMGTGIPYKQLGYHSLSELIASEKSLTFKVMGGSKYVVAAESKSSHVASLIAGQKKQPAKKKKSASLHKLFHLNTPRPNSKLRGGGSSQRSRSGRRGWRNTKNVSPLMENLPTSHGSISSATMPDYYRPKPKSTRPPLLPNPSRSPSLPNQPSHSHMNGIPAGLESEDSFEDLEIEDSHAKISPLFHPTNNNVKLLPEASKPPTSPTLLLQPSWRTSTSTSTSTSLPKLLPSAPIPKPVNLNETDVNSNGYDRTRKISGKSKRAASSKLASIVDTSKAGSGSYSEAFLNLVRSNGWSEPEYLLLPRIPTKSREVYASTVTGTAILCNSTTPVSYDYSTFPDEYNAPEDSKEAVSKKALEGMLLKLEESKKVAPVSRNLELIINRVISIVLPHTNGLWQFGVENCYKEKYQEQLPEGWISEICSPNGAIIAEKLADFHYVVRVNPGSASSNVNCKLDVMALGELEYPSTSTWDVFITAVLSPSEVWFRFVGLEYSAWYDQVMEAMAKHYADWPSYVAPELEVGAVYAYPGPEMVARVELLRLEGPDAFVRHIDHGDIECVPRNHLCILDINFRDLPPQALRASAKDLEPFAHREETTLLLVEMAQGQVLVAVPTISENSDLPISFILHNTSGDDPVNINEIIIGILQLDVWKEPTLCEVGSFSNVTVTSIWKTGDIYCQVVGEGIAWLAGQLAELPESVLRPLAASEICTDSLYVIQHTAGYLRRVQPISINLHSSQIDVCFIDFGEVGTVSVDELVPLEHLSPMLCKVPKQAVRLSLSGVPAGEKLANRVMKLVPIGTSAMVKVVKCADATNPFYSVELYIRNLHKDIISVNATVAFGEDPPHSTNTFSGSTNGNLSPPESTLRAAASILVKPRHADSAASIVDSFSHLSVDGRRRTILQAEAPKEGELFDIYVVSVANPSNFTVIPWEYIPDLRKLQRRLSGFYSQLPENDSEYLLTEYYVGCPCAIKHNDGYWYRAVVKGVLSAGHFPQLLVRFCDFGNILMSSLSDLRRLKDEFMHLPGLGFRASLANIKPSYGDWEVADCVRTSELILEKTLASYIRGTLVSDEVSTILLQVFDTSSDKDIDIGDVLVLEGRAVTN